MISQLDASSENFLFDLARTTQRLNKAQREISSGKRINTVSDAPDQISALLQAHSKLETTSQIELDLSRVKTEVDSAESAMASAVTLVDHARVTGLQAATATSTPENRTTIAQGLGDILNQLLSITRTNVEGRYVFSGDSDQTQPYTLDLSQASPVSAYLGSASTRKVLDSSGNTFPVARTAQQIFDSPVASESIFGSIVALRAALLANDPTGIASALDNLKSAGDYLNAQHAFYGGVQSQVAAASELASKQELRLKIQIGSVEDADIATAAIELSEASFQHNAALAARAKSPRTSLFDYLG